MAAQMHFPAPPGACPDLDLHRAFPVGVDLAMGLEAGQPGPQMLQVVQTAVPAVA